ncbi:MAG: hypothetical protein HC780_26860 [Leptolyngbyaceae cyanobacterium CSU_1_3]|nr:hypothetical protein [Leptolyngbyaceae cyanobacterium CSU_1_3]
MSSQYGQQLRQTASKSGVQNLLPMILASTSASANFANRGSVLQKRLSFRDGAHPTIVVLVAVVSLTSVLGHRYYNQPLLNVGKVSPQTIVSPGDATIEDKKPLKKAAKMPAPWRLRC